MTGWTVDVRGPNGARLITGPLGTAWVGNLANGQAYILELIVPLDSGWYSTTPNPRPWLGDCDEALFGVNFLLLPRTGVVALDALALPARMAAGRASIQAPRSSSIASGRAAIVGPTVEGWLQTGGVTLPLAEADPGKTPSMVGATNVSRSPLGGVRIWRATPLDRPALAVGGFVTVAYDGEVVHYRIDHIAILPPGAEHTALETALPNTLVIVTPVGPNGQNRLVIQATRT